ncbi:bacteriohemerythrin [Rhodospirillum sp. A1_3_36]|uniref:bacteriohemerythrin n=1 Tax=Rhodospirillum sp. A1_3_36 TaxID=3391666 RepID=UPI0039A757DC
MSRIVWRDQMSIGIREIDDDHRALLDLINQMGDLAQPETLDRAKMADCLLRLIRYTRDHFNREEQLMASVHFPGIAKHQKFHDTFAESILSQSQRFVDNPEAVTACSVHAILSDWVLRHVVGADRDIIPHLGTQIPVNTVQWTP